MKVKILLILLIVSIQSFAVTTTEVYNEMVKIGMKCPDVVLRQAVLETGWFKSNVFKTKNNLFGMTYYDKINKERKFKTYNSWKESIAHYKKWQDKHYKGGDYYDFLDCTRVTKSGRCLRYATSLTYTDKLKKLTVNV